MKTITLTDGYCRKKIPTTGEYRFLTIEEVKNLNPGDRVDFITNQGPIVKTATVNGKPKIWKRTPHKVRIPLKYGMYEYASFEHEGISDSDIFPRLVKKVV